MEKNFDIMPYRLEKNIPIILACDNKYVPYTSVLLTSLKENVSDEYYYDILLFQKDITTENKALLRACLLDKKNISLRFIDVSPKIKDLKLRVFSYYSEAIYYRLFAPWILNKYDKILYFDCDLVFNDDVSKLYSIDMGDNLLGAVRDLGMILHKNNPNDNFPRDYFTDYLENININNYFNSGVLLINLKEFRHKFNQEYIKKYIEKKQWRFPDQDVLNIICAGKTIMLDSKWNTVPETLGGRTVEKIVEYIEPKYYEDYLLAREQPSVIHYAMREKPWKYSITLDWQLAKYFWKYTFVSPTKLWVLKEKYKTCSFAELYELISMYDIDNLRIQLEGRNVIAYYDDYKLASLFKQPTLFELLSWNETEISIYGRFTLSALEESLCKKLSFKSDENEFDIAFTNVQPCKVFEDNELSHNFEFLIKIPYETIKSKQAFNFVYIVDGVEIRNGRFDFGKFFPVDRVLNNQYFVKNGIVMQAETGRLLFSPISEIDLKQQEQLLQQQIKDQYKDSYKKICLKRNLYKFIKKLYKKEIWLISDRMNQAGDNGEALFEYLNKNKQKGITTFFAISKTSHDYRRLKKIGKTLAVEGKLFKLIRLVSDKMISSHCEDVICYPYRQPIADLLINQQVVFLQHGVTKDDISSIYNRKAKNLSLFITASPYEYESIINNPNYYLTKDEVSLTGFPRFDKLTNHPKNVISIVPTWRKSLLKKVNDVEWKVNCDFESTDYYSYYSAVLYDERLNNVLSQYGYELHFVQHPLMNETNCYFNSTDTVKIVSAPQYSKVFSESSLLVTDYSSTAFDFAYLRKPVLYYQFDKDDFFSSHTYKEGYFSYEENGFGDVINDKDELVEAIIDYVQNGCQLLPKYRHRIDDFLVFNDKNNCQRVVEAIQNIGKEKN